MKGTHGCVVVERARIPATQTARSSHAAQHSFATAQHTTSTERVDEIIEARTNGISGSEQELDWRGKGRNRLRRSRSLRRASAHDARPVDPLSFHAIPVLLSRMRLRLQSALSAAPGISTYSGRLFKTASTIKLLMPYSGDRGS